MGKKDSKRKFNIVVPEYLKNRLFMIIAGVVLAIALAGGVYSIYLLRDNDTANGSPETNEIAEFTAENPEISEIAEVLPQQKRDTEGVLSGAQWSAFEPSIDPFSDPMRLTGVVIGGRGGNMAIIESSGTSYIVSVGDYVDDLWAVLKISAEMVVMRAYNQEVSLFLDQPPVTRMLDGGLDEDEQEEGV
ncbi:MAG: hypothetical protein SCJ94_02220 [Bacillota bacterium]|nr:hypothetical protein [Bacillota bacterium]